MRDRSTPWKMFFMLVITGAVAASFPRAARAETKNQDRPPNLILIMADDLGAKELSCYGKREKVPGTKFG